MLRSYRELRVWARAIDLAESTYRATRAYPLEERFALTNQTRRAAASIPANIAEGYGRRRRGEYLHYLGIARGSLYELDSHASLALRLGFISRDEAAALFEEIDHTSRMLTRLIAALELRR